MPKKPSKKRKATSEKSRAEDQKLRERIHHIEPKKFDKVVDDETIKRFFESRARAIPGANETE
jgi:hypothetical protein